MFAGSRLLLPVSTNFITIYSTGLARFPRLSAPPHSPQGVFTIILIEINVDLHGGYVSTLN